MLQKHFIFGIFLAISTVALVDGRTRYSYNEVEHFPLLPSDNHRRNLQRSDIQGSAADFTVHLPQQQEDGQAPAPSPQGQGPQRCYVWTSPEGIQYRLNLNVGDPSSSSLSLTECGGDELNHYSQPYYSPGSALHTYTYYL